MKNTVVGLGEILWDIFLERKVLGGAPANFAYHVSQFGFNGYAVSAIGNDLLGKEILKSLEEKELNYLIEQTDFPTGIVKVQLDGRGIPTYEITENVAWDNIPFTTRLENLAKNTTTVCFGSLAQRNEVSRATIHKFLDLMPADSLKVFDINLRLKYFSKDIITTSLNKASALKINDEEIVKIAEIFELQGTDEELCQQLLDKYKLKFLILTKGTRGSYVLTPYEKSFLATPKVTIADTVGAGDSFTAAFVASYLNGRSIAQSHQLAVEVSAYVCQQHGAMPRLADAHLELFR
ncbi:kinase, PfkB family [Capnocytophaga sp. oral taxon 332 str. F0381]|uniref:carbohydrate kinase family protein n=1 Tax=Capnocytophaga sp. oral taxon 332 TaxID=712213 RepID=UPI0002A1EE60|nr:carbohydrate kinase [Capnocytophaga sp. oral taxon 332]EKY12159.1 kinase, PfkB family [Capnocytophaga sp. oral taxon 332 str. F0381]